MESSTATVDPTGIYNYMNNIFTNPAAIIILIIIVLIYIVFFVSLGKSGTQGTQELPNLMQGTNGSNSGGTSNILIGITIFIIFIILLFNIFEYFFSINIITSIQNLFNAVPSLDVTVNQDTVDFASIPLDPTIPVNPNLNPIINPELNPNPIINRPQVFNIPGNTYGYEDAKTLCQAYDSRLATYDEIENVYNKGAEWCNYGWSEGQMALFPTQQKTFDNLQKIEGHEHNCGRPGINGGYIANPHVKFGVNCFGHKPEINSAEEEMMQNTTPYPKTEKDILFEKRVDYWKTKLDEILVSPFNYDTWSKL